MCETTKWLTAAQDARKRSEGVNAIFPAHLPQAAALTTMLVDALAAAAESGVLAVAHKEVDKALEHLRATAPQMVRMPRVALVLPPPPYVPTSWLPVLVNAHTHKHHTRTHTHSVVKVSCHSGTQRRPYN